MTQSLVKEKKPMDMLSGPFKKKILLVALPLMLSGILQHLYSSADLIIAGQFSADGKLAQAAISSTNSLVWLMLNLFMGFAVGVNVACARRIGAKDSEGTQKVVHTAISIGAIFGIFVAIIGVCLCRTVLVWMDSPENVIGLSTLYLRIYFCGMPFNFVYEFAASLLRAKGETKKPLIYLLISGAINVVLNVIFVIVFKMSVAGVAIATIISQFISMVLVLRCLIKSNDDTKLYLNKLKIHVKEFKEILLIGLPAGIQGSMFSISNLIIQSSVNGFGDVFMAGNGNAASIESYLNVLVDSIVKASISFIGQNYGAKNKDNIYKIIKDALLFMTVFCLIASGIVYLFRYQLLSLFNREAEVILAGLPRIYFNCLPYVVYGYMQLTVGFMRGLGKSVLPMVVSICGICVFRVLWVLIILPIYHTANILFVSYPISWALTLAIQVICFTIIRKSVFEKMLRQENAE